MAESKDNSGESEGQKENGTAVPILLSEIGTRISEISKPYGKKGFAARARISESHLYRYLQGKSDPTATRIVAMAKAAGVRPGWLLTGEAPKAEAQRVEEQSRPYQQRPAIDPATGSGKFAAPNLDELEEIAEKVCTLLRAKRPDLSPKAEARIIRLVYEFSLRQGTAMDEEALSNVIELAAYR
ncbi:helix-turn-helix domain-containing protein [Billgrantia ethanolica]|uniref:Helix-turn-helix domain-containing protein n=1 Tax=Billgrantia ethanolica TaxID=2733486 RepID=A0ABS9A603_9GAMM|nr:helix-turn-helix transcriptional regulator [Halomonas ethanolica]MCE8004263.1 helix-turn-helix domain-containing protein [Halomonas ethanolica]